MFAGEFRAHAEAGGLFRLPPIFLAAFPPPEEAIGRQVVVLKSLDPSLWLYPAQIWEAKLAATREHLDDGQSRLLMHYIVAESILAELDSQGRFTIPHMFRTHMCLLKLPSVDGAYGFSLEQLAGVSNLATDLIPTADVASWGLPQHA
jgi:DNA-binding transcriptional regulator/RsmH inhibitor MraZ